MTYFQSPIRVSSVNFAASVSGVLLSATGNRAACVGMVWLEGQSGSKVLSTGGRIIRNTGGSGVWASGSSVGTIGLQDPAATGIEDTTFDVAGVFTTTTHPTMGNNSLIDHPMTTGSKTLTHGQLVCIVIEFTTRGGSDVISVDRVATGPMLSDPGNITSGLPYGTSNGSKTGTVPFFTIIFDDGTKGWISGAGLMTNLSVLSTINFNSGSTPDEYIAAFKVPAPLILSELGTLLTNVATTDDFEVLLYRDPFGSPALLAPAIQVDPDQLVNGSPTSWVIDNVALAADTWYGVAIRPTTVNSITWNYYDAGAGFDSLKTVSFFSAIAMAARTNQTGAFVVTQDYHMPILTLGLGGVVSGGGLLRPVAMAGGLV